MFITILIVVLPIHIMLFMILYGIYRKFDRYETVAFNIINRYLAQTNARTITQPQIQSYTLPNTVPITEPISTTNYIKQLNSRKHIITDIVFGTFTTIRNRYGTFSLLTTAEKLLSEKNPFVDLSLDLASAVALEL